MTIITSIRLNIDADYLADVEAEAFVIVWQQRQTYNLRWQTITFISKSKTLLRPVILVLSIFGAILSFILLAYPSTCPSWYYSNLFLLFFILTGTFAYFMPKIDAHYHRMISQIGKKGCQKMARRFVKKAREQVPFEAEYVIRGDSVTYYRRKAEEWTQVWSRRIKGYAIQGRKVTLLFRKPTSLVPNALVMHDEPGDMASMLDELGIAYRVINT